MKNDNYLDVFDCQLKAIDHCLWLNFKYRIAKITFGVISHPNRKFAVCEQATANELGATFLDVLPKNYTELTYDAIRNIKMDSEVLPFWESIIGLFSVANGEILRFLLHTKMPLERLIRHELASRGYDENHRWCGFDKAGEIWLK